MPLEQEEFSGELAKHAEDDQWRETIILAAGTGLGGVGFGKKLIKALLSRAKRLTKNRTGELACYALAIACLETARQIEDELKEKVLSNLKEIVPPQSLDEARVLSAATNAVVPLLKYRTL